PLMGVALLKAVFRLPRARRVFDRWLIRIAESWIGFNSWMFDRLTSTRLIVEGLPEADPQGHMLVICNHQSWVDIPVLQKLFNRRLPLLRFFLKSRLIWVPLLGLAWWALDFPFMKRYSKQTLARRPELAGRDIETTRRACRKFRAIPVAVMNFVEGTRFTPARHVAQDSPYRHLLRPRSGGIAFVLDAMGETLETIVDVTVAYPGFDERRPELLDLFADRISEIRVSIRTFPVPGFVRALDYENSPDDRHRFQQWLNELWAEKDCEMKRLLERA
ncbi:MAG: acyltransferase, partial [Wenzhouxiangellaceae bacterium]|nr:acyltransferase [Wenzhouxiangellaceae bacterium]